MVYQEQSVAEWLRQLPVLRRRHHPRRLDRAEQLFASGLSLQEKSGSVWGLSLHPKGVKEYAQLLGVRFILHPKGLA